MSYKMISIMFITSIQGMNHYCMQQCNLHVIFWKSHIQLKCLSVFLKCLLLFYKVKKKTFNNLSFLFYRDNTASFSIIDGRDTRYNRSSSTNINMGSEKYRLKWSKYHDNILNAFHSLLETEALSDVTLFCEGNVTYIFTYIKLASVTCYYN